MTAFEMPFVQLFNWGKLPWANEKERNGLSAKVSGDFGY